MMPQLCVPHVTPSYSVLFWRIFNVRKPRRALKQGGPSCWLQPLLLSEPPRTPLCPSQLAVDCAASAVWVLRGVSWGVWGMAFPAPPH